MPNHDKPQLTCGQVVAMLLVGLCSWGAIGGLVLAIVAPNGFPGLLIATTSVIAGGLLLSWLWAVGDEG